MSALELVFLGTGSAYPSPHRGASCIVLRSQMGCWMFDCGEGSQIQLMRSSLRAGRLTKIFITHLHGDHLFGLPGLLCTISQHSPEGRPPMEIYGPTGLRQFLRVALNLSRSQLGFSYVVHELQHEAAPGDVDGMVEWNPSHIASGQPHPQELPGSAICSNGRGVWEVCSEGPLKVCAAALDHRVVTFGYVIAEDELPGKLSVEKLKALGVPAGPLYGKLKQGQSITTSEGVQISPSMVLGPPRPGRKLVVLGDTRDCSNMVPIATNADIVVHEATNENAHEQKARENGHSTPAMAAAFCKQVCGRQLILTHFSQRYKSQGAELQPGEESTEKLLSEAREAVGDSGTTVHLAEDFRTFTIPAKK